MYHAPYFFLVGGWLVKAISKTKRKITDISTTPQSRYHEISLLLYVNPQKFTDYYVRLVSFQPKLAPPLKYVIYRKKTTYIKKWFLRKYETRNAVHSLNNSSKSIYLKFFLIVRTAQMKKFGIFTENLLKLPFKIHCWEYQIHCYY